MAGLRMTVAATLAAGAAAITDEMQGVLDKHNVYRCMHGLTPYTWDDNIAASAQWWADQGTFEHSAQSQRVVDGVDLGENLAWGTYMTGIQSAQGWYGEIQFTSPYGTADSISDSTDPNEAIGHYTALVWSDSTKLGCGKGTATVDGMTGPYWVCQMSPGGNIQGQFTQKVVAPTKEVTECGGEVADVPGEASGELPSSCMPQTPMPHGSLCVYGYQCASKFCCPRLKVCLSSSSASLSGSDLKVPDDKWSEAAGIVFGRDDQDRGGACKNPWTQGSKCKCNSEGQPGAGWDQSACECTPEYMAHYTAGTWILMNEGVACSTGQIDGAKGISVHLGTAVLAAIASAVAWTGLW